MAGAFSSAFSSAFDVGAASGDNLTATGVDTGTPSVGSPTIGQVHVLTATGVATGTPSVGSPSLGQAHNLTATGVATGSPSVGSPAVGQVHVLTATGIATGTPSVGSPALGGDAEETPTHDGGDGFSPAQVKEYRKRKEKKRTAVQELERQIERTYNRIHGLEEPEAQPASQPTEKAATVIARAEQLVFALTAKESQSDRFSEETRGILSNINRLIAMVEAERKQREYELQLEEEAIVLLLAA